MIRVLVSASLLVFVYSAVLKNNDEDVSEKDILRAFFQSSSLQQSSQSTADITPIEKFTVFNKKHMLSAHDTVDTLLQLPLDDMLNALSLMRMNRGATRFTEFITRISLGKRNETSMLDLPPSHQTIPHWFFSPDDMAGNESIASETSTKDDPEQKLVWWREDINMGEHHCNWHYRFPYTEHAKDRQGELFAYMHQQFLARYDFERLGVEVDRVRAFGPGYSWDGPLTEGYNPNLKGMSFRAANMLIGEATKIGRRIIRTDVVSRNKDQLFFALARGYMEYPNGTRVDITMDRLGDTVESNIDSVNSKVYGNMHNDGHIIIGAINDPDGRYRVDAGPMFETATAPRDPVFFRWHKFVDEIFEAHRENLEPYSSDDLVMENIKIDSISTVTEKLEGICMKDRTNKLYTFMEKKKYTVYQPDQRLDEEMLPIHIYKSQMNHSPFHFNVTVTNTADTDAIVAFRIFIAPKSDNMLDEWRNMFVEVDKFVSTVSPGTTVLTRSDVQSSVILPPKATVEDILHGKTSDKTRSKCGWPLRLLIPRGTTTGMEFELYVIATDWNTDRVDDSAILSGGLSYCGVSRGKYPDRRAMGFPFDRKISEFEDLESMMKDVGNSAKTDVTIKYLKNYMPTEDPRDVNNVKNTIITIEEEDHAY